MSTGRRLLFLSVLATLLAISPQIAPAQTMPSEGELRSGAPSVQTRAKADLQALLAAPQPRPAVTDIYNRRLLDVIQDVGDHQAVAELALQCINIQPDRTDRVEYFLTRRTKALLAEGRNQEALAAAKSLYNVCSLRSAPKTIELLSACLSAAHPEDPGLAKRFKLQQLDGAEFGKPVLNQIPVDETLYDGKGLKWESHREWRRFGEGNLMLLCDHPELAKEIFQQLSMSPNMAVASAAKQSVARAIKAEAGRVAQANEYVAGLHGEEKP